MPQPGANKPISSVLIIITALLCFLVSCNGDGSSYTPDEKAARAKSDSISNWLAEGKIKWSESVPDSIYATRDRSSSLGLYYYYHDKGIMASHSQKYDDYDHYADSGIRVLEENKTRDKYENEYINALLTKGNALYILGNYKDAYDYFFKAKIIVGKHPDFHITNAYTHSIAMILYKQGKYSEAAHYFTLDYENCFKADSGAQHPFSYRMQELLSNAGLCYSKLHIHDSALFFYDSALRFINFHSTDFATMMAEKARGVIYGNMGTVYMEKNELDIAEQLLKKSIAINMQPDYENDDAQKTMLKLAEVYDRKNEPDSMYREIQLLESGLDGSNNEEIRLGITKLMYRYYEKKGQEFKSLQYFRRYINGRDSMYSSQSMSALEGILSDLRGKDQQYKIALLEKDKQQEKIISLVIALICIIVTASGIFLFFSFRKISRLHKQVSGQKAELEKRGKEKDRILNVVAHDLRSPLGAINSLANLLLDKNSSMPLEPTLNTIRTVSNDSMALAGELLTVNNFSKDEIQFQDTDLNEFVKESVALQQVSADKKQQTIALDLPTKPLTVVADRAKLTRVMANVIGNAIKFSKPGGIIEVKLERDAGWAQISVKDHGIGIPDNLKPGLFDLFTNSKRRGTGNEPSYGLGLSVAKEIVEAHHGTIWFKTEEGKGSTFHIRIPVSAR